jgi:predicted Zn-dependent protease with MMP-like domain
MKVTQQEFIELVFQSYEKLPLQIKEVLANVDVVVEPWPALDDCRGSGVRDRNGLMGLYSGIPLTDRGSYLPVMPDKITIFQRPIERASGSLVAMVREVELTLLHEVGHYLGMTEADLNRLGYA